jgi:hypothetical protein
VVKEFVVEFATKTARSSAARFATLSLMLPTMCEGSHLTADFILKKHRLASNIHDPHSSQR